MNNFDRPRGITVDSRVDDALQDKVAPGVTGHSMYTSEYSTWTTLSDLKRLRLSIRPYESLNYITFDLNELSKHSESIVVPLSHFPIDISNGTTKLLSGD